MLDCLYSPTTHCAVTRPHATGKVRITKQVELTKMLGKYARGQQKYTFLLACVFLNRKLRRKIKVHEEEQYAPNTHTHTQAQAPTLTH